ncbi:MAG: hypothetical protein U0T81_09495 [Saprospiraceae bacterium]
MKSILLSENGVASFNGIIAIDQGFIIGIVDNKIRITIIVRSCQAAPDEAGKLSVDSARSVTECQITIIFIIVVRVLSLPPWQFCCLRKRSTVSLLSFCSAFLSHA